MEKVVGWMLAAIVAAIFVSVALPVLFELVAWAAGVAIFVAIIVFVFRLLVGAGGKRSKGTTHHHHYHR